MRRYLLGILACGLLYGCGGNNTYNPTVVGNGGTFRLAAKPAQNSVTAGNSVNYTVTGTSEGSFNSPVTLSASGLPQGATASFSPNPFTPTANGADSTLTINTGGNLNGTIRSARSDAGASRAAFTITITGTGGGVTRQTTVQLDVQAAGGQTQSRIAFTSNRDGHLNVFTMNPDGSNQVNVSHDPSPFVGQQPAISPDGTKIAFSTTRDNDDDEIYVMNVDGTNQTRLTSSPGTDVQPAWSPDGTKIAFMSERTDSRDIFVMNADGSNQHNLTPTSGEDSQPAWSPDGTKIAFMSTRDGLRDIFVMNADGSNQHNLTNTNTVFENNPAWSPDGTKIAFDSNGSSGVRQIFVMNADGSNRTQITNNAFDDSDPSWSADGTKIAFVSQRDGNQEIYVMDSNGANQTRLTNNAARDIDASFGRKP